ncbi:MAG: hypothetical protein OXC12_18250 [Spirochaetaceae bacterium]|nr:hypothetical protein [Spirochaetaceae bacterium]
MKPAPTNWDDDPLIRWLTAIDGIVPPFCVEVVLADGSRYSLHSITSHDAETGAAVVRIWDYRGLSDEEVDGVRDQVMALQDPAPLLEPGSLHPRLDWAAVRMRLADVAHCVESYAPLWPERQEQPRTQQRGIGFGR